MRRAICPYRGGASFPILQWFSVSDRLPGGHVCFGKRGVTELFSFCPLEVPDLSALIPEGTQDFPARLISSPPGPSPGNPIDFPFLFLVSPAFLQSPQLPDWMWCLLSQDLMISPKFQHLPLRVQSGFKPCHSVSS